MAFSDRDLLEYMYEQCEIKTQEDLLGMCALYTAYRIFAKRTPREAAQNVINGFKKNKQQEAK